MSCPSNKCQKEEEKEKISKETKTLHRSPVKDLVLKEKHIDSIVLKTHSDPAVTSLSWSDQLKCEIESILSDTDSPESGTMDEERSHMKSAIDCISSDNCSKEELKKELAQTLKLLAHTQKKLKIMKRRTQLQNSSEMETTVADSEIQSRSSEMDSDHKLHETIASDENSKENAALVATLKLLVQNQQKLKIIQMRSRRLRKRMVQIPMMMALLSQNHGMLRS